MYGTEQFAADRKASLEFDDRQAAYRAAVERHREFPSAANCATTGATRRELEAATNARGRLWSNIDTFDPLAGAEKSRLKAALNVAQRQSERDPAQRELAERLQAELDALKRRAWGLTDAEPAAAA